LYFVQVTKKVVVSLRQFSTAEVTFDVDEEHKHHCAQNLRSKVVLDKSLSNIHRCVWIIQKRYSKRNHYLENLTKISNAELNAILNVKPVQ
jgi:hypothetical protein